MMMKIVGSIMAASLACAPAFAEEPGRVEARVCFINDKPETIVFQFPSDGVVRLLNIDGASVTVSESIVTAVLADTGLVAYSCRSKCSIRPIGVRRPSGFAYIQLRQLSPELSLIFA